MSYDPSPPPPRRDNPYESPASEFEFKPKQSSISRGSIPNHMTWAIICLVFCGGVFAIPAIIYASEVDQKLRAGDSIGARRASEKAKTWCITSMCIAAVCGGLGALVQILAIMAEAGAF